MACLHCRAMNKIDEMEWEGFLYRSKSKTGYSASVKL